MTLLAVREQLETFLAKVNGRNRALERIKASPEFEQFKAELQAVIKHQADVIANDLRNHKESRLLFTGDGSELYVKQWLQRHLPRFNTLLDEATVTDYFKHVFNQTVKHRYRAKGFRVKAINYTFDITNPFYLAQLQEASAYLVNQSKLDQTTVDRIVNIIEEGKAAALTTDEIANEISVEFDDISNTRAMTIARTETAQVASQADLAAAQENGVQTKVWVVAGPGGDECDDNESQGEIPIDEAFATGDDAPPAHPNCECYVDWGEVDLQTLADNLWDGS